MAAASPNTEAAISRRSTHLALDLGKDDVSSCSGEVVVKQVCLPTKLDKPAQWEDAQNRCESQHFRRVGGIWCMVLGYSSSTYATLTPSALKISDKKQQPADARVAGRQLRKQSNHQRAAAPLCSCTSAATCWLKAKACTLVLQHATNSLGSWWDPTGQHCSQHQCLAHLKPSISSISGLTTGDPPWLCCCSLLPLPPPALLLKAPRFPCGPTAGERMPKPANAANTSRSWPSPATRTCNRKRTTMSSIAVRWTSRAASNRKSHQRLTL